MNWNFRIQSNFSIQKALKNVKVCKLIQRKMSRLISHITKLDDDDDPLLSFLWWDNFPHLHEVEPIKKLIIKDQKDQGEKWLFQIILSIRNGTWKKRCTKIMRECSLRSGENYSNFNDTKQYKSITFRSSKFWSDHLKNEQKIKSQKINHHFIIEKKD